AHMETRDLQVYELTVAKGGPKLKLSEDQTPPALPLAPPGVGDRGAGPRGPTPGSPPPQGARGGQGAGPFGGPLPRGAFFGGRGSMQGSAVAISGLVNFLTKQLGQQVYDKTGLTGLF